MPYRPAKLLQVYLSNVVEYAWYTYDDGTGDPWIGYAYQWSADLSVNAQAHSSHITPTPYFFDGNDIAVGDCVATTGEGRLLRVVGITYQDSSGATVILEDVDRVNTFADSSQNGQGNISTGDGYLFEVRDGYPILFPVPDTLVGSMPAYFADQIAARFLYRKQSYELYVDQESHGFNVGDVVYLTSGFSGFSGPLGFSGWYYKAQADDPDTSNVIGIVTETGVPGPDRFRYRPVGPVVEMTMPPGIPGSNVYLSDSVAGGMTITQPSGTSNVERLFIKLDDQHGVWVAGGGYGGGGVSGFSGESGASGFSGLGGSGESGASGFSGFGTSGFSGTEPETWYTQTSHGFTPGSVIRRASNGTWVLAQADSLVNGEVYGVVENVSGDSFSVVTQGDINLSGFSSGGVYYLSDSIPGAVQWDEPTTVGYISRPVILGIDATTAHVLEYRGIMIAAELSGTSGFSGSSGFSGVGLSGFSGQGESGFSGAQGSSGFSGQSGVSGFSSLSGTSGTSGFSGVGESGASGASGAGQSGFSGAQGTSGFSGQSGVSGFSSLSGTSGTSGFSGVGESGTSGFSGIGGSGTSGFSGLGESGQSGFSGFSGQGQSGFSGEAGISGTSGFSGIGTSGFSGYPGESYQEFPIEVVYSGFSGAPPSEVKAGRVNVLEFPATGTTSIDFDFGIPENFSKSGNVQVQVTYYMSTSESANIVLRLETQAVKDGQDTGGGTISMQTVTIAPPSVAQIVDTYSFVVSTSSLSDPATDWDLRFTLSRQGDSGSDSHSGVFTVEHVVCKFLGSGGGGSASGSVSVVYGTEVDFLGSATDVTMNVSSSSHAWIEETGWIVTNFSLNGGSLSAEPTVRAGIVGNLTKYRVPAVTSGLTAAWKRETYAVSGSDGETTFTAGMTVAGSITGGSSPVYRGRPYWVIRELQD